MDKKRLLIKYVRIRQKFVLSFVKREREKRTYEFLAALRVTSSLQRFKGSHFYPVSFHARYARTIHLNPVFFLIEASIPIITCNTLFFFPRLRSSLRKILLHVQPYLSFTRLATRFTKQFRRFTVQESLARQRRGKHRFLPFFFFFLFFFFLNVAEEYIASSSNKS